MLASWGPFGTSGNWRRSLETENKVFVRTGREGGRLGESWDMVSRIKGNPKYSLLLDRMGGKGDRSNRDRGDAFQRKGSMKRRGHRVTREAEASVEGDGQCVSLVLLRGHRITREAVASVQGDGQCVPECC